MLINIITPCSRPYNLQKISESINIPRENYRWIVVFDDISVPSNVPENAECYAIKHSKSVCGNMQRSYGLNLVKDGFVYFNDDDTEIHPELWENIKDLTNDFISFKQAFKNGEIRLKGDNISLNNIDSHNFIVHYSIVGDLRWAAGRRDADGIFANQCKKNSRRPIYIPKVLSIYNTLRND